MGKATQTIAHYKQNKEKQYAIKKLKEVRFNTQKNIKQFQVQWEPCQGTVWANTWEPQTFLADVLLLEFYKSKKQEKRLKKRQKTINNKIQEEKIIKQYELKIQKQVEEFKKSKNVSLRKIQEVQFNKKRLYQNFCKRKSSQNNQKNKTVDISLTQSQNNGKQLSNKKNKSSYYEILIQNIVGSKKMKNEKQYYEVQTKTKSKFFVDQQKAIKYFPQKIMQYLEKEEALIDKQINKQQDTDYIEEVQSKEKSLFDYQVQSSLNKNKSVVFIDREDRNKNKKQDKNKNKISISISQNISNQEDIKDQQKSKQKNKVEPQNALKLPFSERFSQKKRKINQLKQVSSNADQFQHLLRNQKQAQNIYFSDEDQ